MGIFFQSRRSKCIAAGFTRGAAACPMTEALILQTVEPVEWRQKAYSTGQKMADLNTLPSG